MVLAGLAIWAGTTLVLSQSRWFARRSLAHRLRPYVTAVASAERPSTTSGAYLLSTASLRETTGLLCRTSGQRLAGLFGVTEDLAVRLERIHSTYDATAFRVRQLGTATAALAAVSLVDLTLRPVAPLVILGCIGAPLFAFLILEHHIAARSAAWQRRVFLELPVLSEQLAMLLTAGYSLGSALNRLAERGRGACAEDLRRVTGRIHQGLSEADALREWASLVRVDALDRLLPVLALNSEAADLGRLISAEARAIRRDTQRELVETMERRAQAVWIPVTVATLVPGVIFLAIPFIDALRVFSAH
jgi:Flp pilus assembly protein TadB